MSKQFAILTTSLTAAALLSLTAFPALAAKNTQTTESEAKAIALKNAGIKESDTAWLKVQSDTDDGRNIYEVKFFTGGYAEYEYEILAENGKIIKIEYDAEAPISRSQTGKTKTSRKTLENAKSIALSHAGLKEDSVTFTKAETDYDDGMQLYEIEFTTEDKIEYEFEIDASTGMILAWSYDAEKTLTAASEESGTASKAGSMEDAKKLALKTAGLTGKQITWGRVKEDYDDGRLIYEGKFFYGELEYEFEIDAASMTLIDWDVENIYD